ncbi:4Fe-4S binding protein [Selenomonadales bacterium OttesenSCG-928-I06]|nr:4Fe-4S binding protein [Selenomonadales bacterium OttesenSCG-928-I06]
MAFVISDECVFCGACAAVCPVEAIKEGDDIYVINADECINCGTCFETCPSSAIKEVE